MGTTAAAKPGTSGGYFVGKAHGNCDCCHRDIAPGEKLVAVLRETPEAMVRQDICPACWPGFNHDGLLAYWQTTMPLATAKRKMFVDDEVLCQLFERLGEATEPAKLNFRFVLGLILMRKRKIAYENTRTEGEREIWTVRFRGRDDKFDLLNPRLTEQQVGDVSAQLGEILNEEL